MQCSRRAATTAAARAAHKEALAAAAAALGTSDSTPLPPALEPEVLRANAAADAAAAAEERALMSRKVYMQKTPCLCLPDLRKEPKFNLFFRTPDLFSRSAYRGCGAYAVLLQGAPE